MNQLVSTFMSSNTLHYSLAAVKENVCVFLKCCLRLCPPNESIKRIIYSSLATTSNWQNVERSTVSISTKTYRLS